jgi:hypothetical protein
MMSVERARERGRGECDLANPCQRCRLQQKQAAFAKFPQRMRKLIFSQALSYHSPLQMVAGSNKPEGGLYE